MDRLHVATLNILNLADRWYERLPLILADMAALQPDLFGLQEVVYVMQQDRLIGAAGESRYGAVRGWAGRPEYGNSLLVREPLEATGVERLELGLNRAAHRAVIALPAGPTVLMVVTHLHHLGPDEDARAGQAAALLGWLDGAPATDARIVVGDFNADPAEPTVRRMLEGGYRSAYAEVNGADPAVTWPSGLQAPAMDTDGLPGVPRLHLGVGRGPGGDVPPRLRPAGPRGSDALSQRPHRPVGRTRDRVGEGMPGRTLRLAHRGDWRTAPENSVAAMQAALAIAACDGLEFDVRTSADGVPVVIHDATLARVQGHAGEVEAMSAAELAAFYIPTLAAVLEIAGRRAFLDVELKTVPGPSIIEILAAGRGPELLGAVISSFDEAVLVRIGRLAPSWPRWLNSDTLEPSVVAEAVRLGCVGICAWWESIDQDAVDRVTAAGLTLGAYTIRNQPTFDRLANLGLVAVIAEDEALDG